MRKEDEVEIVEVISSAEEKFEFYRKRVGLFLGPITGLVFYLLPFESLSPQAHTLAAVLAFVCMWWVTEPIPIPVTALLVQYFV